MSPNLTAIKHPELKGRYCISCGRDIASETELKHRLCTRCIKKTVLTTGRCR